MTAPAFTRRGFVGSVASLAGLSGCRALGIASGRPDVRFGVVSDVHLNHSRPGDEDTLIRAFEHFRDRGADGVVIAGDIADSGRVSELRRCADAWYRVFPCDRAPDGRHVEKLFVYGNHDCWGSHHLIEKDPELAKRDILNVTDERYRRAWEECFHEPYSDFWIKTVRGFSFVGAHWTKRDQFGGLAGFLKEHAAEIGRSRPFFYVQHSHPKDTCIGPWAWGRDDGASTRILSDWPNAVAFSGHSHYPLTDERSVWQGAFTSINTASLRYCSLDYSLRENVDGNSHGFRGEGRKHLMGQPDTGTSRHGMLVSVYGPTLVIERRDFVSGRPLGDDWVISVPCREDRSFETLAKARTAPQFAADARLSVSADGDLLTVAFPAAQTVDGCRVFEYEATATLVEDGVDLVQAQRRVMAPDFFMPETPGGVPGKCVFSAAELTATGNYVFSVRPLDCFGLKGAPISASFRAGPKAEQPKPKHVF